VPSLPFKTTVSTSSTINDLQQLNRCDGGPRVAPVAAVSSKLFSASSTSAPHVGSTVVVWRSAKLAAEALRAEKSTAEHQCLLHQFAVETPREFPGLGAKVLGDSITPLTPPTSDGLGQRLKLDIRIAGHSLRHVSDTLEFARGPYVIDLSTTSSPGPFPKTLERELARLLVERAIRTAR
jgi:hypothetical protein